MSSYQLIAFDMDGTLLNSEKKISAHTLEMIQQAFAAGKEVVLSTGRCMAELRDYLSQIPHLRYIISASGALVYDWKEKRAIYAKRIPVPTVMQILQAGRLEDAMEHLLTEKSTVQASQAAHMDRYGMGQYQGLFQRVTTQVEDLYAYYQVNPIEIEKVNLYHQSLESRERSRERLKNLDLELVYAEESSLECSAPGVSKGLGLKELCEFLEIPMEQTIAVGDADNDIEVLKCAGLSIAMGNANEQVKKICSVTVSDCDHDGCAEAIETYLL